MRVSKPPSKKQSPPSQDVLALVDAITVAEGKDLIDILGNFTVWRYPRGDLQAWIRVLDKFDEILAHLIENYGLSQIQTRSFSLEDKNLILQVLRVQRMLMENCTNRKLFASYDRLYDLLITNDLEVLETTLLVLLRPFQQYMSQAPVPPALSGKLSQRLLSFARGWERLSANGWTLAAFASKKTEVSLSEEACHMQIQFYPEVTADLASQTSILKPTTPDVKCTPSKPTDIKSVSSSNVAQDGLVTLDLGNVIQTLGRCPEESLSALGQKHHIPLEVQVATLNKARLIIYSADSELRDKLVTIRLLALASYGTTVQSSIFLYEPSLLGEIAEILASPDDTNPFVLTSAILALDSCARHRSKISEVLSVLNANISHGILMTIFKSMVNKLVANETVHHECFDAVLTMIAYVSTSSTYCNMLVGAGLIPILIQLLDCQGARRASYIPRALGLIDSIVYTFPQTLTHFTNADGINALVAKIKSEVQIVIDRPPIVEQSILSQENQISYVTQPLKSMLRSTHRMLQASGGADGLRNIVDSDLPKSLKRIFVHSDCFGPRVHAQAINIMATIIHNEPTSLSILQEIQLPQTLYEQLEQQAPSSYDVICAVPNAVGAICLNTTGLQATLEHFAVISNLIKAVACGSTKASDSERDSVHTFGQALDEVVRHHPPLRPKVLETIVTLLRSALEEGSNYRPGQEEMPQYSLLSHSDTNMDLDVSPAGSQPKSIDAVPPSNEPLTKITKLLKLLGGFLHNSASCKDFIKENGLELVLSIADSPCLPVRFHSMDIASALSVVFRSIGETDHSLMISKVIESVSQSMAKINPSSDEQWSVIWASVCGDHPTEETDIQFRQLQGLSVRLSILSDALFGMAFATNRYAAAAVKALQPSANESILMQLGVLHRSCFKQHVLLKSEEVAKNANPAEATALSVLDLDQNLLGNTAIINNAATQPQVNPGLVKVLTTRTHAVLIRIFKTAIKLLFPKRNVDALHRDDAATLASTIGKVIIGHLQMSKYSESHSTEVETLAIGLATILLFDERAHEGHLQTALFMEFEKQNGLQLILEIIGDIVSRMDTVAATKLRVEVDKAKETGVGIESDQDTAAGASMENKERVKILSALKVSLSLLSALVHPRALLDNPQTTAIVQRDSRLVQPILIFMKMRRSIFPVAERIWLADWLLDCPVPLIKLSVITMLTIAEGKDEDLSEPDPEPVQLTEAQTRTWSAPRVTIVADPDRVNQLVDMGFGRAAAASALLRVRNNVAAATDLLLSMPHMFPTEAEAEAEAEAVVEPEVPTTTQALEEDVVPGSASIRDPETSVEATNEQERPVPESMPSDTSVEEGPSLAALYTDLKQELDSIRQPFKKQMAMRSLIILDRAEDLVFDLLPALPTGSLGASFVIEQLEIAVNSRDEHYDKAVAARLRLLSVFLRANLYVTIEADSLRKALSTLSSLELNLQSRPVWAAAFLLAFESIYTNSMGVSEVKIGDDSTTINSQLAIVKRPPDNVIALCKSILAARNSGRDELLSAMRLLVVFSRLLPEICDAELIRLLLSAFKQPATPAQLQGCHSFLMILLRRTWEKGDTVVDIMRDEIREWMSPARKVVDVNHYVRQLRHVALRNVHDFVSATGKECTLVDPDPPQSVYHIRSQGKTDTSDSEAFVSPSQEDHHNFVMDILLQELSDISRVLTTGDETTADNLIEAHAYAGLLLSAITELVGSYQTAKDNFMLAIRSNVFRSSSSGRSGLSIIINDLLCCSQLKRDIHDGVPSPETARRLTLSNWVSSMLIALCSDVGPQVSPRDRERMTPILKTIIDGIGKAIKDASHSSSSLNVRYGRLWTLSNLIHRLLTSTMSSKPQQHSQSTLQIAKLMLEKNFVALLTTTLGEIDVNFPGVRNVLVCVLKALELLSKIAIKWGKSSDSEKAEQGSADLSDVTTESSDSSDVEMTDEEEAPDLYRNSALGILGGDIGDEDEDDMDEDEEADDEEMIYEEDMDDDDGSTELSMEGEEDMEEEWTDEGDGSLNEDLDEMEEGPPLGEADDVEPWEDDMAAVDEENSMFEEDQDEEEDEEDDILDEDGFEYDSQMEEDHEELEILDEEDGYDEVEGFDGRENGQFSARSATNLGAWGWQSSMSAPRANDGMRRSRLLDVDASAAALFGLPDQQQQNSEDGTNHPLLTAEAPRTTTVAPGGGSRPINFGEILAGMDRSNTGQALEILETILMQGRQAGADAVRVDIARQPNSAIGLSIGGRHFTLPLHPNSERSGRPVDIIDDYRPLSTSQRWRREAAIVTPSSDEQLGRIVIHLINRLLPAARRRAAAEESLATEADMKADVKTGVNAAGAGTVPLQAGHEERVEPGIAYESTSGAEVDASMPLDLVDVPVDVSMEPTVQDDVDNATEHHEEEAFEPTLARVTISIHGRDVDITDTGIDLEFLEALPDDMRADVIEQHLREQNAAQRGPTQTNLPAASSQINADFLEALPPDIRAEVLMQEALETNRRQAPVPLPSARNADLSLPEALSDILDNDLRDVIFGQQPSAIIAGTTRLRHGRSTAQAPRQKRDTVQLLDKSNVATLIRLLFFPEALKKDYLLRVLVNLCQNSKTRSEILNLLLSVVQDGSADLLAVDRSFQQMSIRGLTTPRTPVNQIKPSETPGTMTGIFGDLLNDHIPTFIAQRCFEALAYIVGSNEDAVTYFLTEHDHGVGLKKPASKKGKGKEKHHPQSKYPIVILLGLLERSTLLKTPGMAESLTSLLAVITRPLASIVPPLPVQDEAKERDITDASSQAPAASTEPTDNADPFIASSTDVERSDTEAKRGFPVIPSPVLRLIVNSLTVGDCTSRTFSQTLSVIQSLSHIPEAKSVLIDELCTRARQLGSNIEHELEALNKILQESNAVIDNHSLSAFTPPWSNQAQLLRLLKSIDYLHSKKADIDPAERELSQDEQNAREIFRSFDFGVMWEQLSQCLAFAELRESTEQISVALLPLVEALMVICSYTRSPTTAAPQLSAPLTLTSTPPPSDLFVKFTSQHRKVLNTIVRNNPALMSGSFSLLVANPRILDFDNKRNWFFQKLKRKRDAVHYGVLHVNVKRQYVLQDSFSALRYRTADEIKYGKISVKFLNEDGVDAGGVTREWYSVLAQQIFDPNFALFEPCTADKQTYQPNKFSSVNDHHIPLFKFVGRVIGKAVYDGRLLDAYFSRAFYKQILGRTVDMRDLESIDPEYHKSLQWMLDNDITGVIDQEFTIEDDAFGEKKIVELKEGGAQIPVTEANKEEYVKLVVSYRLESSIKEQMSTFLEGFYDIIPRHLVRIFEPDQLELLISGITTIDVDELRNSTQMSGWKSSDPEISWFWRALRSFSQEERSRFLMFVTSSSRVPLGGFTQLQGSTGTQPFQIQKLYGKENILPQASTCFNLLLLPSYTSYEQLRERLLFAVMETGGFGKA